MHKSRPPSASIETVTGTIQVVNFKCLTVMPGVRIFPENSVPLKSTPTKRRLRHIKRIQVNHEFIASSSTTLDSELLQSLSFALFSKTEKYLDEKDKEQFKTIVLGSGVKNEETSRPEKSQLRMPPIKKDTADQSEHTFVTTVECKESLSRLTKKTDPKRKPHVVSQKKSQRTIKSKDQPNKSKDRRKNPFEDSKKRPKNPDYEWANASLLLESVSQPFHALCNSQSQKVSDVSSELQFKSENKYGSCQNNFDMLADFLKQEDLRKRGLLRSNVKKSSCTGPSEKQGSDVSNEVLSTKSRRKYSPLNDFCSKIQQKTENCSQNFTVKSYSSTSGDHSDRYLPSNDRKITESARNGKCNQNFTVSKEARIAKRNGLSSGESSNNLSELHPKNEKKSRKNQLNSVKPGLESKLERNVQTTDTQLNSDEKEDKSQNLDSLIVISNTSSPSDALTVSTNCDSLESEKRKTNSPVREPINQEKDIKSHRTRLADSFKDLTMHRKEKIKAGENKEKRKNSHGRDQKMDKKTLGQKISLFLHKKRAETEAVELIRPDIKGSPDVGQTLPYDKNQVIVKPKKTDRKKLDDSVETIELVTRGKNVKSEHQTKPSFERWKTFAKDSSQSSIKLQSQKQNRKSSESLRLSKKKVQMSKHHHHHHNHRHRHHEHQFLNKRDISKHRRKKGDISSNPEAFEGGISRNMTTTADKGPKSESISSDSKIDENEANHKLSNNKEEDTKVILKNGKTKRELQQQQKEDPSTQHDGLIRETISDSKEDRERMLKNVHIPMDKYGFLFTEENSQTEKVVPNIQKKQRGSNPFLKSIKSKRNLLEKSQPAKIGANESSSNDKENSNFRDLKYSRNEPTKSKKDNSRDRIHSRNKKKKSQKEPQASKKRIQNLEHLSAGGSFQKKKQTPKEERNSTLELQDCIVSDHIADINCVLMYPYRSVSQTEIRVADSEVDSSKSFPTTNRTLQNNTGKTNAGFVTQEESDEPNSRKFATKKPSQFNTIAITSDNYSPQTENLVFRLENITSDKIAQNNVDQLFIASYTADEENEKPDEEIKVINYDSPKEMSNILDDSSQKKSSEKDRHRAIFKLSSPPTRSSLKKKEKKKIQKRGKSQDIWNAFSSNRSKKKHWSDVGQTIDEKLKVLVSTSKNYDNKQSITNNSKLKKRTKLADASILLDKQFQEPSKRLKYQSNDKRSNDSFVSKTFAINKEGKDEPSSTKYVAAQDCSFQIKGLKLPAFTAGSGKLDDKLLPPSETSSSKDKIKKRERTKNYRSDDFVKVASEVSRARSNLPLGKMNSFMKSNQSRQLSHDIFGSLERPNRTTEIVSETSSNRLKRQDDATIAKIPGEKKKEEGGESVASKFEKINEARDKASNNKRKTKTTGLYKFENCPRKLSAEKLNQKLLTEQLLDHTQSENDPVVEESTNSFSTRLKKKENSGSQQGMLEKSARSERRDEVSDRRRSLRCRLFSSCSSNHSKLLDHSLTCVKKIDHKFSSERRYAVSKYPSEDADTQALRKSSLSAVKDGRNCTCVDWSKHPCICSPSWPKANPISKNGPGSQEKVSEPKHRTSVSSSTSLLTEKSNFFQDSPFHDTGKTSEEDEDLCQRPMIDFSGQTDFSDSLDSDDLEGTYAPMIDSSSNSVSISSKIARTADSTERTRRTSKTTGGEQMTSCENIGLSSTLSLFNDTDPSEVNDEDLDDSVEDEDFDQVHCRHSKMKSCDKTTTKYRRMEGRIAKMSSDERCFGLQVVDPECTECNLDLPVDSEERSFSKCSSSLKRSGKSLFSVSSKHQTYVAGKLLIGPSIDDAIIGTLQLFNQIKPLFPFSYSKPSSRTYESDNCIPSQFDSVSDETVMRRIKTSNPKRSTHHTSHSRKTIHRKARIKNQKSPDK